MKVLLTGATGAIGRVLLPKLIDEGHTVIACTRRARSIDSLARVGSVPLLLDALQRDATIDAICRSGPHAIVHGMTALAQVTNFRTLDHALAPTNLLRTRGLDNLLEGARLAGTSRFVAQSYGGWSMERCGQRIKTETDPLAEDVPRSMVQSLAAIHYLESTVTAAPYLTGSVLRYGSLYGAGTAFAKDGSMWTLVKRRSLPLIGSGDGIWSFLHIEDAASAVCAALRRGESTVYNIADDEPVEVNRWLPTFARLLKAREPFSVPRWVGSLLAGESVTMQMTDVRGLSNAKAKQQLHWRPSRPLWRDGFVEEERAQEKRSSLEIE